MDTKLGLVLEGGAMRGLFTCGVTDVMMEHDIWPDGIIGVSAGAAFGCNYKSRQPGRAIRYNKRFAKDRRYSGLWSLVTTGDYFNAQFAYHVVPDCYDLFDNEAFEENPMEFVVVCTDVNTGQPVYRTLKKSGPLTNDWIRASASMPLASRVVELEGYKLLDGGVADSIPLAHFERLGYKRNVVILTQPAGYQKRPMTRILPLMRMALGRYPAMIEALRRRYMMYNQQLAYVDQAEHEGRCLVIRPERPIPIGHVSHNADEMERAYQMGRQTGEKHLDCLLKFFGK